MKLNYKEELRRYLIDLDEKYFDENDYFELMQTTVTRKHIEKNLSLFTFKELENIKNADKKVFEYMEKYPNEPVYPVLENIAKIIGKSKLYEDKEHLKVA